LLRSDGKSPILWYGLLVIVLILWYSLVWEPLSQKLGEMDAKIETQEQKIDRLDREIRRNREVDQEIKQAGQKLSALTKNRIPGDTPQLVASNLQDMLLKRASEADLEVITYKTARERKWRGRELAVTTFTVKTDTRKLVHFLKLLEDDRRVFRVYSINVVKVEGRNPHLRVSLEVEALFVQEGRLG
jgi:type II secretory pathway component PulM